MKLDGGNAVQLLLLLAGLTLVPALIFTTTGFTRILIVLGFVRTGLGTPTAPPNQVLIGIAFFLTLFVMAPTLKEMKTDALDPLTAHHINDSTALERAEEPLRKFMFKQTSDDDLSLFVGLANIKQPQTRADVPTWVLIPAFITSELKTAFQIGFLIFLPFLVIDLVVSSTLMSMGMIMLPPAFISLPFKILLFVLVDGWNLVMQSLVELLVNQDQVVKLAMDALLLSLKIGLPLLLAGLIVGLVVSVFQAVTQIQEMTLSFIPKILAVALVLVVAGPWMLDQLVGYTADLYHSIPGMVKRH